MLLVTHHDGGEMQDRSDTSNDLLACDVITQVRNHGFGTSQAKAGRRRLQIHNANTISFPEQSCCYVASLMEQCLNMICSSDR